jgi:phage gp16-like protein
VVSKTFHALSHWQWNLEAMREAMMAADKVECLQEWL